MLGVLSDARMSPSESGKLKNRMGGMGEASYRRVTVHDVIRSHERVMREDGVNNRRCARTIRSAARLIAPLCRAGIVN